MTRGIVAAIAAGRAGELPQLGEGRAILWR